MAIRAWPSTIPTGPRGESAFPFGIPCLRRPATADQRLAPALIDALRMDVIRRPRPADAAVIARRAALATTNAA